ncbi:adenosine deaminase [Edwardsiella hoshinae]|uniref:Adenine deaminase n=1 Tax=Edwardsiella hoshinae TaxID=93378 RepID=A0A376D742_9GAMM|nr:adenosine deaminase [Edwardsiella hoshinae]QPR28278.1 adenosine deaminase [Edwardsiella hoshinae]STC84116.1 Adenine deaminase [Edwardsiella hoshinae]
MPATQTITWTEFLTTFPKVDLHYHLLGGVRLETMRDLARRAGVALSERDAKSFYRRYQAETGQAKGGIAALNFLYPLLRSPQDYYRVMLEVAEDAAATGVRHLELFWNPSDTPLPYDQVTAALAQGLADAARRWEIHALFLPAINREKSPEEAVRMVETVLAHPHPLVAGIGIDYREHDAPIEHFWKAYRLAQQGGLRLTGHCSEFGLHWRNVESGLDLLQLERIDHGYSIVDNPELLARCARDGIPFTVVPSNTYFLKRWPEHEAWRRHHPIRRMAQAGLTLIPATDDWHMHDTNGAECYRVMVEEFGFDLDGVRRLLANGIDACWQPEALKAHWHTQWLAEFDALRARLEQEPCLPAEHHLIYPPHNGE